MPRQATVCALGLAMIGGCTQPGQWLDSATVDEPMSKALTESTTRALQEQVEPRASLLMLDAHVDRVNRYAMFIPEHLPADRPAPCIVFLHGRGECGVDGFKPCTVGLVAAAMSSPEPGGWGDFVIIAPQKPGADETWEDAESRVLACLRHAQVTFALRNTHGLDARRTYLTGLSQGGAGTWAIGARHPELFAAIAPVCGFVHEPGKPPRDGSDEAARRIAGALAAAKMPVWAFHGEKDDVVPPSQTRRLAELVRAAAGPGAEVKETYYPEANHNSWDSAYRADGRALAAWLLSHARP